MNVLFVLLPLSLLMATAGLLAFIWSVKSGQFDDLDAPAQKLLVDELAQELPKGRDLKF